MTRDDALAELRRLLAVAALDVHRDPGDQGYRGCHPTRPEFRSPRAPQWWITLDLPRHGEIRRLAISIGPSGSVRNPRRLNAIAGRLGRSRSLPPLTAQDGHSVIKLLHAINDERTDDAR